MDRYPTLAQARLWEYIEPIARGERYEDPLQQVLSSLNLGEVTGGGTQLGDSPGIKFVDIEVCLADGEMPVKAVVEVFNKLGAPIGSELTFERDGVEQTIPFGSTECAAVFLDGISLPTDVYKTSDVNVVLQNLKNALGERGHFRSHWRGNDETALFFYGNDAEQMYAAMLPVLGADRLCQNARVVLRFGRHPLEAREVRMLRRE